jgi:hypothetical protein
MDLVKHLLLTKILYRAGDAVLFDVLHRVLDAV